MNAVDLSRYIAPKSDQLNADDLIGGSRTITITKVSASPETADQPVSIHFEGDEGKPYKPCKSMRRVMVAAWGNDGHAYVGRSMTLYRDEKVMFGGIQVGGIRISHMSHIDREMAMALTVTRAKRMPYTVKPLKVDAARQALQQAQSAAGEPLPLSQRADNYAARIKSAPNTVKLKAIRDAGEKLRNDLDAADPERLVELEELFNARFGELQDAEREGAA